MKYDRTEDGAVIMKNAKTVNRYKELFDQAIIDLNENGDYNAFDKMFSLAAQECDPQEVYFYEFNNHECMYAFDGDDEAMELVIKIFGVEKAKQVNRVDPGHKIETLMIPHWVRSELMMLDRLQRDCDYYLGYGNRSPKVLWALDEKAQIEEMRKRLERIPEEYRPKGMDETINEYERKMATSDENEKV